MSKKRFFALITSFTLVVSLVVPLVGSAEATTEQLQAIIAQLTNQITALTARLNALTGGTAPAAPGVSFTGIPANFTFVRNIRLGSSGDDVKYLQIVLNTDAATRLRGSGIGSPGQETSYFGPLTRAAVIKFQNKYAVEVLTPLNLTAGTGIVGAATRAKLNSLLLAAVEPELPVIPDIPVLPVEPVVPVAPVVPVVVPMSVKLSDATPAAGSALMGEANKVVTMLDFTGSATADTTISSLVVTSFGTARLANEDIANVKIFDGTRQVGLTQNLIAGRATFTFAPAIIIPAGQTKPLSAAVSIVTQNAGAQAMSTVRMGINAATDIGGATFTGSFPVIGSTFNILPAGALGTLNVAAGPVVPSATVRVGSVDTVLGSFTVSAGPNENVVVTQFNVNNNATGSTVIDTDVTNVRVRVDGSIMGSSSSFSTRRATIDFAVPITITKGTSKTFQVVGDVMAGVNRVIGLAMEANGVFARGVTSGVGLGGPATGFDLGAANQITIQRGALSVSQSTLSPTGAGAVFVRDTVARTMGVFDIRAIGEAVSVSRVTLAFPSTGTQAGSLTSVGLYDGDALISQLENLTADNTNNRYGPAQVNYNITWTIPANTTKQLYVKAVTTGVTGGGISDPLPIQVQLALTGGFSIVGTGLASAGLEGSNNVTSNSTLALSAVSITQGPLFTAIGDAAVTPRNQAILSPLSEATVAAIRVTAQRENQTLRSLSLQGGFQAALTTNLMGDNNDLTFTADAVGTAGNSITIAYVNPMSNNASLVVSVAGSAITVTLSTDGNGAITATANAILADINAHLAASALVTASLAAGNNGTGVVTAMGATNLAGGLNAAALITTAALFDGNTAVSNWVAPVGSAVSFTAGDIIVPTAFTQNVAKALTLKANIITGVNGNNLYWQIPALGLSTAGVSSGLVASNAALTELRVNSGNLGANTGGVVTLYSDVLTGRVAAESASGNVSRSSNAKLGTWVLTPAGTSNLEVTLITFASKVGGLGGAGIAVGDFKLYDETNGVVISAAANAIDTAAATVTFTSVFQVPAYRDLKISLLVDTTSAAKFPNGTQLHWTVLRAGDITVQLTGGGAARGMGIGSTGATIPMDAHVTVVPTS